MEPFTDTKINSFFAQAELTQNSNRFIIGTFEKGITLYKQQMRALNLLYSIKESKRLNAGDKIAIIGGGVSGITAAAASLILGFKVYLFEKSSILCHLQYGCDIRWIHPHLYDWPDFGTELLFAGLPFLNWRAGIASEVIEQLQKNFTQIVNEKREDIQVHKGVTFSFRNPKRIKWQGSDLPGHKNGEENFDAVIFAIGFGVELEVEDHISPSYWRNDSFNQLEPGAPPNTITKYLITGTGDGGLIDLLRVTIDNYNQGRIIYELFDVQQNQLMDELRRISIEWKKEERNHDSTWLYDQFNELHGKGLLRVLSERLDQRIRKDTKVILNGKLENLSEVLRLDRASLLNTLLVYSLEKLNAFDYKSGECQVKNQKQALIDGQDVEVNQVIVRHGTEIEKVFRDAHFDEGLKVLSKTDKIRTRIDTSSRLWPAGWWGQNAKVYLRKELIEFVPPATLTIANTFVSTLSDIINLQHRDEKDSRFRINLHRIIKINEEELYQQISRYVGTRLGGTVGRVFDIKGGIVGLACRLGKPVIVKRDRCFKRIWEKLHLDDVKARPVNKVVQSLLACPFFAPNSDGNGTTYVSLILFMDSAQPDFFTDEVLEVVYTACKGFVKNVEIMKDTGEVIFSSSDYLGHELKRSPTDEDIVRRYKSIKTTDNDVFRLFKEDLTFKTVTSFEADLNFNYESTNR